MKSVFTRHGRLMFISIGVLSLILFFAILPKVWSDHFTLQDSELINNSPSTTTAKIVFIPSYVSTPSVVKGIYMTSWTASNRAVRDSLVKLIDDTELNSVVIDIKDYSGKIVFPITDNPSLEAYGSDDVRVKDLQDFIEGLHKKGIYVIGRIAVFQDAYFVKLRPDLAVKNASGTAVWKDHKGISWIDPDSREYWDYIVSLSKEARKIGFDEINFDYIRFPSDGDMQDISYPWSSTTPKSIVLRDFFEYLNNGLSDSGLKTSADLFGMTTSATDDMGIGQVLENALPYFNFVDPMVYPSHYPTTFLGYKNPEQYPYQVVEYEMQSAVNRAKEFASTTGGNVAELRPWLQDFGLTMDYGPEEVKSQIKATNDVGLPSWILWSASNKYTAGALNGN